MNRIENGVSIPMTPEEIAAQEATWAAFTAPSMPLSLRQVAAARLDVSGWDVSGVERSEGIAGAYVVDTDVVWVVFTAPFPDDMYCVFPSEGITKYPDFVEVTRPGLVSINFIIQRVQ